MLYNELSISIMFFSKSGHTFEPIRVLKPGSNMDKYGM